MQNESPAGVPGRSSVLELIDVAKSFELGQETVDVLRGVTLSIGTETTAILGPSGSGKSTLLHIMGTLDQPTSGTLRIAGTDPLGLSEPELARFRNETIGFIFQEHHLLPQYDVVENVLLPALAFGGSAETRTRAEELVERVGLGHRKGHQPAELSGGERQRVAVARALINEPKLLLCDEPTGSLDSKNAEAVTETLLELAAELGAGLVVVTHSQELATRFDRRVQIADGQAVESA